MKETPRQTNVLAALRIRPILPHDSKSTGTLPVKDKRDRTVAICKFIQLCSSIFLIAKELGQVILSCDRLFQFDHVFGPNSTQEEVYNEAVEPLITQALQGYNATVFAYGQTGSGKTHTMGNNVLPYNKLSEQIHDNMDETKIPESRLEHNGNPLLNQIEERSTELTGIIPRVLNQVFDYVLKNKHRLIRISITFLEIYRENIYDLLQTAEEDRHEISLREDKNGALKVTGLNEITINSAKEGIDLLAQGTSNRTTAETAMHDHSSRSHAILSIIIRQQDSDVQVSSSPKRSGLSMTLHKISLVDLAGSERMKRTQIDPYGVRFQESIKINAGLLALANVIRALTVGTSQSSSPGHSHQPIMEQKHIPYRQSKLTRFLQDSLGGTCFTLMVGCVSPLKEDFEETLNTVLYTTQARKIENYARRGSMAPDVSFQKEKFVLLEGDAPIVESKHEETVNNAQLQDGEIVEDKLTNTSSLFSAGLEAQNHEKSIVIQKKRFGDISNESIQNLMLSRYEMEDDEWTQKCIGELKQRTLKYLNKQRDYEFLLGERDQWKKQWNDAISQVGELKNTIRNNDMLHKQLIDQNIDKIRGMEESVRSLMNWLSLYVDEFGSFSENQNLLEKEKQQIISMFELFPSHFGPEIEILLDVLLDNMLKVQRIIHSHKETAEQSHEVTNLNSEVDENSVLDFYANDDDSADISAPLNNRSSSAVNIQETTVIRNVNNEAEYRKNIDDDSKKDEFITDLQSQVKDLQSELQDHLYNSMNEKKEYEAQLEHQQELLNEKNKRNNELAEMNKKLTEQLNSLNIIMDKQNDVHKDEISVYQSQCNESDKRISQLIFEVEKRKESEKQVTKQMFDLSETFQESTQSLMEFIDKQLISFEGNSKFSQILSYWTYGLTQLHEQKKDPSVEQCMDVVKTFISKFINTVQTEFSSAPPNSVDASMKNTALFSIPHSKTDENSRVTKLEEDLRYYGEMNNQLKMKLKEFMNVHAKQVQALETAKIKRHQLRKENEELHLKLTQKSK